jgi:hypothetical protein
MWQRVRTVGFGGALTGGVAGLLAEQRVPSSAGAWVWWGAVFGAAVGALFVATATITHAARVPNWLATPAGCALLGWQVWAALDERTGPADGIGRIALRDVTRESSDPLSLVATAVLLAIAHLVVGRLRSEHLARRGGLVSQLRFAVTMQDLRTVVLLRRQLSQERSRPRPWIPVVAGGAARGGAAGAVVRRGVHGMLRTPAGRIGRMALLAGLAGVAAGVAARGTTPAIAACTILLFVLGLDLVEPLAQEIDHPDRTLGLPQIAGWLHGGLLIGPAVATVPFALIGAASCAVVAPDSAPAAFALAVPVTLCGLVGAAFSTVRDQYDPLRSETRSYEMVVPPEVAGFSDGFRVVWPVLVSAVGMLALVAVRSRPEVGTVVRALIGLGLWLTVARSWIVHRAEILRRWRAFAAGAA